METRELKRTEWRGYFDGLSKMKPQMMISMEEVGMELGSQPAMKWLSLSGITYDTRAEALDIITDQVDHRISHPTEIYVREENHRPTGIEVVDEMGIKQIIELRPRMTGVL